MNAKSPTLKDVAILARTSVATASVVLNETPHKYVTAELKDRVLWAAGQLCYRPNRTAQRMKGKGGRFLAILVPQFENVYFHRIVIAAENYANSHDYTLSIFSTYDQEEKELKFVENLISLQVDGILISPAQSGSKSVALLKKAAIPFVVIDRPIADVNYDLVSAAYYQAGYEGAKILIDHGHRRIAFFGWKDTMKSLADRVKGFQDAAGAAGLSPEEIFIWEGERNREAACEAALRILELKRFTAIFAGHHQLAEGIVDALKITGYRVPDDISVLVFGNPPWASIINPRYSCISQPDLDIGTKAAELIIDRLENPGHQYQQYILPCELYPRESIKRPTP